MTEPNWNPAEESPVADILAAQDSLLATMTGVQKLVGAIDDLGPGALAACGTSVADAVTAIGVASRALVEIASEVTTWRIQQAIDAVLTPPTPEGDTL